MQINEITTMAGGKEESKSSINTGFHNSMFAGFEDDLLNRTSKRLMHLTTKVITDNMEPLLDDDEVNEKLKQRRALGQTFHIKKQSKYLQD